MPTTLHIALLAATMLAAGCGRGCRTTSEAGAVPVSSSGAEASPFAAEDALAADQWDPRITAGLVVALLAVWPERMANENPPQVLPTPFWGGLHTMYNAAEDHFSLRALELLFEAPVFVSGPHGEHPSVRDPHRFGHYNSLFLTRALRVLGHIERSGAITAEHRAALADNVTHLVRTLLAVRDEIDQHGGLDELEQLWRDAGQHFVSPDDLVEGRTWLASAYLDREGLVVEAATADVGGDADDSVDNACGFWVRRHIDGTAPLMRQLLLSALGVVGR